MKKSLLYTIFCLFGLFIYSQNEASTWYFGYNSGIKFDLGTNTISPLLDGNINTFEGCASISNNSGDLLFYTDGITVWNRNHKRMSNGNNLNGDPSSTQSAIIVPKPNNPNIYYIFTVDDHGYGEPHLGLNYSEIDMTLDGGLGAVVSKNNNLLEDCTEKITAVLKDCDTKSIWVIAFASEDGRNADYNTFHAFEVTDLGVNETSTKSTFPILVYDVRGYLKLSPDGKKMACANASNGLYIYDFEAELGTFGGQQAISIKNNANTPYGVEFSPNSKLLYVTASNDYFDFNDQSENEVLSNHRSILLQYNLEMPDIENSAIILDDRQLYRGGLQLGPNGKIYRALSSTYTKGLPYLGVINNPNSLGASSNYKHNGVSISPFRSSQGLPPFISSFFNAQIDIIKNGKSAIVLDICDGGSYTLISEDIPNVTYTWTLDGVPLATKSYKLEVFESGHYEVLIKPNSGNCSTEGQAYVNFTPNPEAFNHTLLQCDEDGLSDGLTTFNLNQANDALTGGIPNLSTKFYIDSTRTSEIDGDSFSNTTNPQIIYVEVINDDTGCSSNSELTIQVSVTDSNDTSLAICDDDGREDGVHLFNLNDANNYILDGIPLNLEIFYYATYDDAILEQNTLNPFFTNTKPYSQTIYARVENANNCYGISEVILYVNSLPDIKTDDTFYYCLNDFPSTITIDAQILKDNPDDYSYNWSTGESSYDIEINTAGIYSVTITNSNNCSKERTVIVKPSNIANFETPAFHVDDATQNNIITVLVSGDGTYQYSLIDKDETIIKPYQDSNIFENISPGIYTVLVKDVKNNCGIVNKTVSVIGFPKFFTPNNDGVNDTWQIIGVSGVFQPNTKINIYNRFGKLLKQLDPLGKGWNGLLNGERLPTDDYWFYVKLQDGRVIKDHFTLKY